MYKHENVGNAFFADPKLGVAGVAGFPAAAGDFNQLCACIPVAQRSVPGDNGVKHSQVWIDTGTALSVANYRQTSIATRIESPGNLGTNEGLNYMLEFSGFAFMNRVGINIIPFLFSADSTVTYTGDFTDLITGTYMWFPAQTQFQESTIRSYGAWNVKPIIMDGMTSQDYLTDELYAGVMFMNGSRTSVDYLSQFASFSVRYADQRLVTFDKEI